MRDIESREDLALLMESFYTKMLKDEELGYIFNDVAQLDLSTHLLSLTNFWENMLLTPNGYRKNVMQIHLDLNNKVKLEKHHFGQWLNFLEETIAEHFQGEKADTMLSRARSIAAMMELKMGIKE